ncbi:MAG: translational GTPase TypA [Verrucomicrobiae bacterium]|nr:translational GTPase TypA [Verrucomicrobiae bacterium]
MRIPIRNIAIIAHVDHGKTTLVDKLLWQAGVFRSNQTVAECVMDSMDLEREKGITIKAKNASVQWCADGKTNPVLINIVDTPGHADFGGEVERIMRMVDGALLLVDAYEGPQAQTKFVLKKALAQGLRPIVLINKVDREHADPHKVLDQVFGLFMDLHATDAQLDFPALYGSGRDGYMLPHLEDCQSEEKRKEGMRPLFETIVRHVPAPQADPTGPFQFLICNLGYDDHLGRIAYGKVMSGQAKVGDAAYLVHQDGKRELGKLSMFFSFSGISQHRADEVGAGNITGITGFDEIQIGESLVAAANTPALPFVEIDPPTITMTVGVNDGPLAGREGKFVTARNIKDRLFREARMNVSLEIEETESGNLFTLKTRGEMQVAILVEQMRREGYEVIVSRPEVIYRKKDGQTMEPFEELSVEVEDDVLGDVLQSIARRKGQIVNMEHHGKQVTVHAEVPTRGLIGFETELVNLTSGGGIMSHAYKEYRPVVGEILSRLTGTLVSMEGGPAAAYALDQLQERGRLFVEPQDDIYVGMIVGENPRREDINVNPCKTKHLTNMRSQGDGKGIVLEPPLKMSLERAIEYIEADEYVEATPKNIRLRKRLLDAIQRKRAGRLVNSGV